MENNSTLFTIIIGFVCGIIGYFIGKSNQKTFSNEDSNYKNDLDVCNQKNKQLKTEVDTLKSQLIPVDSSTQKLNILSEQATKSSPSVIIFDAVAAKAAYGKKVKLDDLKIIEGIGPKIEELFKTSGILTWKRLSETSVDRCNKILHKAGDRYRIHNPATWPKQAKLAYQGKWAKLKKWQDELDGGKEKK